MNGSDTHIVFRPWRKNVAAPQHRSLWVEEALDREPGGQITPLEGDHKFDVAIIGGGLSGLWTAIRLKEADPALDVAIVEADICGTGASGRNSGAVGHWWSRLPVLVRYFGETDAVRIVQASMEAIADTHSFIKQNGIDCQARIGPSVWSTNIPSQVGAWEGVFRMADKLGIAPPYRRLSGDDLRQLFGSGPYYSGVSDDEATRIQPAMLCRALRTIAISRGVRVFEQSPVREIVGHGADLSVRSERGSIACAKVVMAANAWMAHLDEFRPHVMVLSSDVVVTDPIPDLLDRLGMRERPGGVNSRQMLNYGGLTPEGRVYLGRGGGSIAYDGHMGPEFDYSPTQSGQVEADFRFLYPELKDVPVARTWAGPIDRCTTGLPTFGQLKSDSRIHYAIGYTGHGLGASNIAGHVLSSQILGRIDGWTNIGDILKRAHNGFYPREPLRYVAGWVVRGAVLRKERAEQAANRPSGIDTALSKFALATIPSRSR